MSRSAFASLVLFFFCVSFVASAPVLERFSSYDLVERFSPIDDYGMDLAARSWDDDSLEERDLNTPEEYDVFQRGFGGDSEEFAVLERRANKVKQAFQKAGHAIKAGVQKAAHAVKSVAKKAVSAVKQGAQKVNHFMKTTGAKVAKFGLKVMSTAQNLGSKVAKFIPVIGQPISAAMKAASIGTGKASDAIHANLGKKLNKGMNVMNIIGDPVGAGIKAAAGAAKKRH